MARNRAEGVFIRQVVAKISICGVGPGFRFQRSNHVTLITVMGTQLDAIIEVVPDKLLEAAELDPFLQQAAADFGDLMVGAAAPVERDARRLALDPRTEIFKLSRPFIGLYQQFERS